MSLLLSAFLHGVVCRLIFVRWLSRLPFGSATFSGQHYVTLPAVCVPRRRLLRGLALLAPCLRMERRRCFYSLLSMRAACGLLSGLNAH